MYEAAYITSACACAGGFPVSVDMMVAKSDTCASREVCKWVSTEMRVERGVRDQWAWAWVREASREDSCEGEVRDIWAVGVCVWGGVMEKGFVGRDKGRRDLSESGSVWERRLGMRWRGGRRGRRGIVDVAVFGSGKFESVGARGMDDGDGWLLRFSIEMRDFVGRECWCQMGCAHWL